MLCNECYCERNGFFHNEHKLLKFSCQVGGAEVGGLAGEAGGAGRRRPRGGAPPRRKITEHCSMPVF